MNKHLRVRTVAGFAALVLTMALLPLSERVAGASPEHGGNPSVTLNVSPTDGDNLPTPAAINVTGAGFGSNVSGDILQCAFDQVGNFDNCSNPLARFTSNSSGVFTQPASVSRVFTAVNGGAPTSIDCLTTPCTVQAVSDSGLFYSAHHISFSPPQVSVGIGDNFFNPAAVTVVPGTSIKWTNNGLGTHTVTADDGAFNSGNVSATQTFTRTFSTPGVFRYYCTFHGAPGGVAMAGTVTVSNPSSFHPLASTRVLDTRTGIGAPVGAVGQTKIDVQVLGAGGVPTTGVGAVVLNLAETGGTGTTQDSWVTAWPAGPANPGTANLNYGPGTTLSNLIVVPVGTGGKISLAVGRGTAHLILDVQGWLPTAGYNALTSNRILDTRNGTGAPVGAVGQTKIDVQVLGNGGVPSLGVGAVVLNLAETGGAGTTQDSWVTAWPAGLANPGTANLNYGPGKTLSNLIVMPVGADGKISLAVGRGSAHLILDVQGWLPTTAYTPLASSRILDTRNGTGAPAGAVGQTKIDVQVLGTGGVPSLGVGAVVLNLAETGGSGTALDSWVTAWPSGPANPGTANLNYPPGATLSNLVVVPVGTNGKISLAVGRGVTHLILDVQGWFAV